MQGDAFAVKAAFCRRKDALRLCKMLLRVGDHGGIVHQPQPLYTSLCRQRCALAKGAVPPLRGLRLLLRQGIGGIAEQKVCALRRLLQRRAGRTVAGKDEPQPLDRKSTRLNSSHVT